jgi:Na+/citrate or Na+/malate symporter
MAYTRCTSAYILKTTLRAIGNIAAIIYSGYLARLALKQPNINGEGALIRAKESGRA